MIRASEASIIDNAHHSVDDLILTTDEFKTLCQPYKRMEAKAKKAEQARQKSKKELDAVITKLNEKREAEEAMNSNIENLSQEIENIGLCLKKEQRLNNALCMLREVNKND